MSTNGKHTMSVQIEKITPTRAKELLANNTHNRNLRPSYVEQLVGAIERNEWMPNTDAIAISPEGLVLNGQHRLHAIVEAKHAVNMLVAYNVPREAQETMDIGAKRSVADMLKMRGYTDVNVLAASARLYWFYTNKGTFQTTPPVPTAQQVIATAEAHRNIILAKAIAVRVASVLPVTPTLTCALWALFIEHDEYDVVSTFWDRLETGDGLRSGDAIYALRQHLHRLGRQNAIKRPPTWVVGALLVKGFNAWRQGRDVQMISFKPGVESFPLIDDALAMTRELALA